MLNHCSSRATLQFQSKILNILRCSCLSCGSHAFQWAYTKVLSLPSSNICYICLAKEVSLEYCLISIKDKSDNMVLCVCVCEMSSYKENFFNGLESWTKEMSLTLFLRTICASFKFFDYHPCDSLLFLHSFQMNVNEILIDTWNIAAEFNAPLLGQMKLPHFWAKWGPVYNSGSYWSNWSGS